MNKHAVARNRHAPLRGEAAKRARHDALRAIVADEELATQDELVRALARAGHDVTQATLSRDIRELGLAKSGGSYRLPEVGPPAPAPEIGRVLRQLVLGIERSAQILVFKTRPGRGHMLGVELDGARWPEILGTVAGDDTLLAVTRDPARSRAVLRRVRALLVGAV